MEGLRIRQASETISNECIAVRDLPVDIECAGTMLQKPDYFLLGDVVKALKWRNEINLIRIGAGFRSPFSTAQTVHLNASCLVLPLLLPPLFPFCSHRSRAILPTRRQASHGEFVAKRPQGNDFRWLLSRRRNACGGRCRRLRQECVPRHKCP